VFCSTKKHTDTTTSSSTINGYCTTVNIYCLCSFKVLEILKNTSMYCDFNTVSRQKVHEL